MQCYCPINIRDPSDPTGKHYMAVPCGKCFACLSRRREQWVFRLQQELKVATSAYFITLTYDDEHLPFTEDGLPCFSKRDVQLFLKRYRKELSLIGAKIRYFLVSEYGGKFGRPHYHMILFNHPKQIDLYECLTRNWQQGFVSIGTVNARSISYCAKYSLAFAVETFTDERKPFMLCSRRPAIGANYLTDSIRDYHLLNNTDLSYVDGVPKPIPRYYRDKIFTSETEKDFLNYKKKKYYEQRQKEFLAKHGSDSCRLEFEAIQDYIRKKRKYVKQKL